MSDKPMTEEELQNAADLASALSEHIRSTPLLDAELSFPLPGGDRHQIRVLLQRTLLETLDLVAEVRRLRALFPNPEEDAELVRQAEPDTQISDDPAVISARLADLAARIRQVGK